VRVAIWVSVAILISIVAAFSSLWARSVIAKQTATSSYIHARTALAADLRSARMVGLFPSELQPLVARAAAVNAALPPAHQLFWSNATATFYNHQSSKLRALDQQLHNLVQHITAETRHQTRLILRTYQREIQLARYDGLAVKADLSRLRSARLALAQARTPGAYRAITQALLPTLGDLRTMVNARQAELTQLRRTVESAPHPLHALQKLALAKVSTAENELNLLRLFVKRPGYGQPLANLQHEMRAATLHQALVAAVDINNLAAQLHTRFVKVAPPKWILVSTEGQWARMYQGTRQVYFTYVTTGGPELPTDHGFFHIYMKASPWTFHSPWPPGSPYYYPPTPIQYWMPFYKGEGLHDAWWRSNFGPGSNLQPTYLGDGNVILGTHGCVNMPLAAARFVWNWAPVGTPVIVI
jgi:lipoprotein-anchoring transpeptidase ErfK/SrfK